MPINANGKQRRLQQDQAPRARRSAAPSAANAAIQSVGLANPACTSVIGYVRPSAISGQVHGAGRAATMCHARIPTGIATNVQAGRTSHGTRNQASDRRVHHVTELRRVRPVKLALEIPALPGEQTAGRVEKDLEVVEPEVRPARDQQREDEDPDPDAGDHDSRGRSRSASPSAG